MPAPAGPVPVTHVWVSFFRVVSGWTACPNFSCMFQGSTYTDYTRVLSFPPLEPERTRSHVMYCTTHTSRSKHPIASRRARAAIHAAAAPPLGRGVHRRRPRRLRERLVLVAEAREVEEGVGAVPARAGGEGEGVTISAPAEWRAGCGCSARAPPLSKAGVAAVKRYVERRRRVERDGEPTICHKQRVAAEGIGDPRSARGRARRRRGAIAGAGLVRGWLAGLRTRRHRRVALAVHRMCPASARPPSESVIKRTAARGAERE